MGPQQVLPIWVKVDLGVMATKRYSTFPKAPGLEPRHQMQFSVVSKTLIEREVLLSAEMQLAYSTIPADWATSSWCCPLSIFRKNESLV